MVDTQTKVADISPLNLARKWRSRNFDEIVGQNIAVRMLKNSLYIGQFFPVYLFSGQRGCGKTSTARVFAAAVNCEQLQFFRQDPKRFSVPCGACGSCRAMLAGKHPDCIEIDAASHTGVDHVRQIIDAASLLPLLGNKKIYLIDEAHMLSKAAFNAFLKILEEPPASVLFILATTDPEKIIDTVRSRCFQVIFKPIDKGTLVAHLENICIKENIAYEKDALVVIAQESEGAARDALNVLEQVRFAHKKITKEAVFDVLGHVDDERLLELYDALLNKSLAEFASVYAQVVTPVVSPAFLWHACIELFRASLSCAHQVPLEQFVHLQDRIEECIEGHTVEKMIGLMRLFYEHETMFLKTTTPHAFLQMLLFQACQYMQGNYSPFLQGNFSERVVQPLMKSEPTKKKIVQQVKVDTQGQDLNHPDVALWAQFLTKVDALDDPLVASVFKQGHVVHFDMATGQLKIVFPRDFAMFEDMLMQAKKQWQPLLDDLFKKAVSCMVSYQDQEAGVKKISAPPKEIRKPEPQKALEVKPAAQREFVKAPGGPMKKAFERKKTFEKVKIIDVSDKDMWKKTNLVLDTFPGIVTELQGGEDVTV